MSSNKKLENSTFSGGLMGRRKDKPRRMEEEPDRHQTSYPQHWMLGARGECLQNSEGIGLRT